MSIGNLIKTGGIRFADFLTNHHVVFDKFTRPIIPPAAPMSLEDMESYFFKQIQASFILSNGIFTIRKVYDSEPVDLGDQALWHGIYTAMLAKKFLSTGDKSVKLLLDASLVAMKQLFQNGFLVRGRDPVSGAIQDNVSNDALTGIMAGIYFATKAGANTADVAAMIGTELINHNYALVNQDGSPTTYGQLENGVLTDPLRITLLLAMLRTCVLAGYVPAFEHFVKLSMKYGSLIPYAYVRLIWLYKDYDMHRAALHLYVLEQGPTVEISNLAAQGLERIWKFAERAQNPWVGALCGHLCVDRLKEFDPVVRGWQIERINSTKADYWKQWGIRFIIWNDRWEASQPLPFWAMGTQDFFFQRDLFSLDNWQGSTDAHLRFSGLDFLCAYWFSK